jgi:hypothetical protein
MVAAWIRATVAGRARVIVVDTAGQTASAFHTGGSTFEHIFTAIRVMSVGTLIAQISGQLNAGDTTAQYDDRTWFHLATNNFVGV